MTLRTTVAVPFKETGVDTLTEGEFVVALSLDRDWFSAERASRLVEVALEDGLLTRTGDALEPTFDPHAVDVPAGFTPSASLVEERSTFERVLAAIVADGGDEQESVAAINRRQQDLAVTADTAAVLVAHERGLDVGPAVDRARGDIS